MKEREREKEREKNDVCKRFSKDGNNKTLNDFISGNNDEVFPKISKEEKSSGRKEHDLSLPIPVSRYSPSITNAV